MSAKKYLAFQTFRGSKSHNLDLIEVGLLDIPSEWYPYPGPFENWNAELVLFERLSRRYEMWAFNGDVWWLWTCGIVLYIHLSFGFNVIWSHIAFHLLSLV
jgi:hypothetical protein